jgi:hypothetical protein
VIPFDLAMADLRDRFEAAAPGWGWFARMVASTQEYFEACVWEAANRQRGLTPNVDSYMDMRRCAGGMYIYADFIELVARAELPLVARRQMDVRRLVQIACNVSCWHNDLFSLEKEVARGDVHNLAVVLARQHGLGLREGRAMAVDHCNREVAEFSAHRPRPAQLRPGSGPTPRQLPDGPGLADAGQPRLVAHGPTATGAPGGPDISDRNPHSLCGTFTWRRWWRGAPIGDQCSWTIFQSPLYFTNTIVAPCFMATGFP